MITPRARLFTPRPQGRSCTPRGLTGVQILRRGYCQPPGPSPTARAVENGHHRRRGQNGTFCALRLKPAFRAPGFTGAVELQVRARKAGLRREPSTQQTQNVPFAV